MYDDLEQYYVFQVVTKQVSHLNGCFCAFEILVALATKTDLGAVVYTGSLWPGVLFLTDVRLLSEGWFVKNQIRLSWDKNSAPPQVVYKLSSLRITQNDLT